jgi:hypothetical protein
MLGFGAVLNLPAATSGATGVRFYARVMRRAQTRMVPLCGFVVHRPPDCLEAPHMADLLFLGLGGGAFLAFAGLAAALKRV